MKFRTIIKLVAHKVEASLWLLGCGDATLALNTINSRDKHGVATCSAQVKYRYPKGRGEVRKYNFQVGEKKSILML